MSEAVDQIDLYAGRHAIEIASFAIAFATPLDQADMRRFDESKERVAELFPAITDHDALQIPLPPVGQAIPQAVHITPPKELVLYGADGQPLWTGMFGDNAIVVSCCAYTDWKTVWPQARERLVCLAKLVSGDKLVRAVDYTITDAFSAKAQDEVLLASKIFAGTRMLPAQLNEYHDPRWDFAQGWYEKLQDLGLVLKRIRGRGVLRESIAVVKVDNVHSRRFDPAIELQAFLGGQPLAESSELARTFNKFHDLNKELLKTIIKPELLARMGLAGNE